ncbi:MAG: DNA polymerase III subunit delta [Cardiobacteriaceae bacterium]|nr:DNA polymerase III subunit delta [Cardiobacteriaceae bacterium]
MNLAATDTVFHFKQHPLPAITLIYGSEPVLNAEALDAARIRARSDGYTERQWIHSDNRIDRLISELETPSLFANKRLLEYYFEQKKADKETSDALRNLADFRMENNRLIIFAPNLEKPYTASWYKALFARGNLSIESKTLYPPQFTKQIDQRLHAAQIRLTETAYERLLTNCQGNLLAAKQAIERLRIHPQSQNIIDDTLLAEILDDFSQFSTFSLENAILNADWLKALHIANRLQSENPRDVTLITWLLQRDSSLLLGLAPLAPNQHNALFKQYKIMETQQRHYQNALHKHNRVQLRNQLHLAAKLDRITKGAEHGDYWYTLKQHFLFRAQQQSA